MTAVAAPSPPGAPAPPAGTGSGRRPPTPRRMRTRQVLLAVVLVVIGLAVSVQATSRIGALDQAGDAADLVVASQLLRAELGRADAAAVNAFLAAGVDQPDQRERYEQAVTNAGRSLQDAIRAGGRDATGPLDALGRILPVYTGLVETARADNRQNLPVGGAYLRQASELARVEAGVEIEAVRVAGDESLRSVDDAVTGGFDPLLWLALVAGVGLAVWVQRWFAAHTRRLLNAGMVAGVVVLAAAVLWAGAVVGGSAADARDALVDGYDEVAALSAIRSDAFDAKARATFALVDRGARAVYGASSETAANNVEARLDALDAPGTLPGSWAEFRQVADEARTMDDEGRYDDARRAITRPVGEEGSVNGRFEAFDAAVVARIENARTALVEGLDRARSPLVWVQLLGVTAGLVAAAVAAAGLQRRIDDYR